MREAPSSSPAAPREYATDNSPRATRNKILPFRTGATPSQRFTRTATPTQIHQVSSRLYLTRVQALVSHVYLLISLTELAPSGSTSTTRLCQGRLPPNPLIPADQSGSRSALLRPGPLRTARAAFTASSSSKPRERLRVETLCSCAGELEVRSGRRREQGGLGHRPLGRVSRGGRGSPRLPLYG
jgi:hypothetical protein